ncbi:MAG: DNA-formamidopyrimidine glycosylase family protein [Candidatus Thorarchaeota archaeon]
MSVELPEAQILAEQMSDTLLEKKIKAVDTQDSEKLQKIGFMNKKLKDYQKLVGCKIKSISQRGNVIRVYMNKKMNLVLCPDYGAKILYHKNEDTLPKKHHFKAEFTDGTFLTVRQTGMGVVYSATDEETKNLYVIKRDFSDIPSPIGEHDFTFERFVELLDAKDQNIKAAIVGKSAVVVGLSNAAFQEIIYKAGIHPKRNTSTLTDDEKHDVYDSMKEILNERICSGGKDNWVNLYGESGRHTPVMGPNMKDKNCPRCNAAVEKIAHGGGQVYFCPRCQR